MDLLVSARDGKSAISSTLPTSDGEHSKRPDIYSATRNSCRSIHAQLWKSLPRDIHSTRRKPQLESSLQHRDSCFPKSVAMPSLSTTQRSTCIDSLKPPTVHHSSIISHPSRFTRTTRHVVASISIHIATIPQSSSIRHSPSYVFVPALLPASPARQRRTFHPGLPQCTLCDG